MNRHANRRMKNVLQLYKEVKGNSFVSMSDLMKIGLELSIELFGGPRLSCSLGTETDASTASPSGHIFTEF